MIPFLNIYDMFSILSSQKTFFYTHTRLRATCNQFVVRQKSLGSDWICLSHFLFLLKFWKDWYNSRLARLNISKSCLLIFTLHLICFWNLLISKIQWTWLLRTEGAIIIKFDYVFKNYYTAYDVVKTKPSRNRKAK